MRQKFTDRELKLIRQRYPDTATQEIAELLGRSATSIYNKAHSLGLKKSAEFMRTEQSGRVRGEHGRSTRFKPGQAPWNKGKSYKAGGRSAQTRFKKGNVNHNRLPVGSERITKDGIRQRKVSDTGYPPKDWKSVHSIVWEERHGPIPKAHIIVFRNGNRTDIRIENLEMISRAENARRNSIHRYPKEIKTTMMAIGRLNKAIQRREKAQ